MNKTIRIVLYVLSILTVAGVIAAFIFSGGNHTAETGGNAASLEDTNALQSGRMDDNTASGDEKSGMSGTNTGNVGNDGADLGGSNTENSAAVDDSNAETDGGTETDGDTENSGTTADRGVLENSGSTETTSDTGGDTTLIFTGDVLFANAFQTGYDARGITGVLSEELLQELNDADILMINNEFPFSDRGEAMADKQFVFRCSPSYGKALTEMGVDIVSLANNHTLDYGKDALRDTFTTLDEAGILYGGAGDTVERAQEIQVMEVNGKKFGFIAVSRVIPTADWKVENSAPGLFSCYDETRLLELIQEGKKQCDFLTVFPHWGTEYSENPDENQLRIAEKCMEAGADLIVGAHTHCLQGVEYFNGKPVFYSLGNFIFGQSIERSAAVEVTVKADGTAAYRLIPVYAAGGVTQQMDETSAGNLYAYMQKISVNAAVDSEGNVTEIE